mmetsp:Transcript_132081/g.263581  ORF Transcript_132081/g.263581 Transcript_132081/m.263581 type:complete len:301 (-) Transcript_132081:480-1382(-)|eukprot:CAMPEP_0172828940 /NCGR_PEP_ID=MMETSP1075-20121228/21186_1 /TAXON_ID=2916 /ORGANISM="Ceratium fusus, Strain PA161109" /LENGTH=300 /DNA_ID=CAMNT_0013671005 /DNA_START=35 /DNA_END=937 /DNA_ORIENTATION=+
MAGRLDGTNMDVDARKRSACGMEEDADLELVRESPQLFSLFRLLTKQSSRLEARIEAVEAKTESHSAQITNIMSELVSLRSKMAVARTPTPCTSNSSAHSGSQLAGITKPGPKTKEANPSVIIWANPDHEIYRKQMVEECGKMLLNYGIKADGEKHDVRIGAGSCGKRATIHFLNGASDANKFFQMAVKNEHRLTRSDGTVITMRLFKDQSSVEQRKGHLINMAAKFLAEKKPELGSELVKEKFKGRIVYEYRCALKINVNEHTLVYNIDHHDAEILEKFGTSIGDVRAHLKQMTAGWTG